ncbi:hypothetical protein [Methylobacterium sp. AMS5]|uniref:hypothetical protein n=1 Tax=Methylobacterium sp. AMS5 TaxID=925818 RepID=UPI00074F8FDF|nr:hypothetical protein [Methylobacterium sp. AMS5]AMB45048.1 hypothetical protein Y590_09080 [Methylobacterium sp. AMS5]
MTRAFYTMPAPHRTAFRAAVAAVRDSHPGTTPAEAAFLALDVDRPTIERTHTLELHARVAEQLALTPQADRAGIEAALFGTAVGRDVPQEEQPHVSAPLTEDDFIRMVVEGEAAALRELETMDPDKLREFIREFRTPTFFPWSLEPPSALIEIEKAPAGWSCRRGGRGSDRDRHGRGREPRIPRRRPPYRDQSRVGSFRILVPVLVPSPAGNEKGPPQGSPFFSIIPAT